jgi:hypothetical protein
MRSLERLSNLSIDSNDLAYALIGHALIRNGAELAHRFTDPELGRVSLYWDDRLLVSVELSPAGNLQVRAIPFDDGLHDELLNELHTSQHNRLAGGAR